LPWPTRSIAPSSSSLRSKNLTLTTFMPVAAAISLGLNGSLASSTACRTLARSLVLRTVDASPMMRQMHRGKLCALGLTTAESAATAPEIPPLAEVGAPGYDAASWVMLTAPAKTPKPILTRLNAEVNSIVNTTEVKRQLVNLGVRAVGSGSLDELDTFVKAEMARWAKVVQEAGLAGSE
jgi:tripartite-type tricarboxylate transporter receptor subunit TctC